MNEEYRSRTESTVLGIIIMGRTIHEVADRKLCTLDVKCAPV